MEPMLRASLATLAALALLGGLVVFAHPRPARRYQHVGLLLHHGVALSVAVAAALGALIGGGDGRSLLLCAAGPLLVLCLRDVAGARIVLLSLSLVVTGLVLQALILLRVAPVLWASPVCAVAALVCGAGAVACMHRRRQLAAPRAHALLLSQAIALSVMALGALSASAAGAFGAGTWAVAVGAAGAMATAGRLQPLSPPGGRELCAALVVVVLGLVAGASAGVSAAESFAVVSPVALVSLAAFALVRAVGLGGWPAHQRGHQGASADVVPRAAVSPALGEGAAGHDRLLAVAEPANAQLPSAQALAAMSPLLDDALLRRPGRPHITARVSARRLLDAALDKARSAQPWHKGRRQDLEPVEVIIAEGDSDIDCDPAELADALCAVLDNALRARALAADINMQVIVRGGDATVTFEVSDTHGHLASAPEATARMTNDDAPFMNPRNDVARPGLGVSLARARLLVQRNGGTLSMRTSAAGCHVQVTMPRRMHRDIVGQA